MQNHSTFTAARNRKIANTNASPGDGGKVSILRMPKTINATGTQMIAADVPGTLVVAPLDTAKQTDGTTNTPVRMCST